eukprot:5223311-Pleurochrysis_carterae.AAC.1
MCRSLFGATPPKQQKRAKKRAGADADDDADDDDDDGEGGSQDAASGAIAEGPPISGRSAPTPFNLLPESEKKRQIRIPTSRQLREMFDALEVDFPPNADVQTLRALAYEFDIVARYKQARATAPCLFPSLHRLAPRSTRTPSSFA